MYVYKRSEDQLWTVGYYDPTGEWQPESDHRSRADAAQRVHFLNGGDSLNAAWRTAGKDPNTRRDDDGYYR